MEGEVWLLLSVWLLASRWGGIKAVWMMLITASLPMRALHGSR